MSFIRVCSLALVPTTITDIRPWGMISLLDPASMIDTPEGLEAERHLKVGVNDIIQTQNDLVTPQHSHVREILAFAQHWDQNLPLLVHCWAGVSRSTATAFIIACQQNPDIDPAKIAQTVRARSPTATPNRLLVSIADELLARGGAMVAAVDAIGRGADCWEGIPFDLSAKSTSALEALS
jgi:predicted protein tyrosine phosphatase